MMTKIVIHLGDITEPSTFPLNFFFLRIFKVNINNVGTENNASVRLYKKNFNICQ